MPDTPAWVRDAVFYQIFPDRFAASERVPKPGPLEPFNNLSHFDADKLEQKLAAIAARFLRFEETQLETQIKKQSVLPFIDLRSSACIRGSIGS